jgi:hypothetical protein
MEGSLGTQLITGQRRFILNAFMPIRAGDQMTVIEITPHHCGWKAFEAPGVEPVFPTL